MLAGEQDMKLSTLWVAYISYCLGEIVALVADQYGKWGTVFLYLIVFIPAVALAIYTERVMHPRKKLPVRRMSRVSKPRNSKVVR